MDVAIVGTGFAAEMHAKNLTSLGHRIAVVVDRLDIRAARAFAEKWGAESCSGDLADAFAPGIDFVHICTVPTSHYEEVKAALLAGKNVVCEKPLCLDPREAAELSKLAAERGLINAVCFNIRFYDACEKMKERLSGCGGLCLAHGEYLQEFHALPDAYTWRYKEKIAGPMRAVTEIGSHWFDMLRYVTGSEVASVSAMFGMFTPVRKLAGGMMYMPDGGDDSVFVSSEDAALVTFRMTNGAMGEVTLSEVSHGRTNKVTLELCGRESSMWWDSEDPYRLWSGKKGSGSALETASFTDGFGATFRDMFTDIYTGSGRSASFEDGRRNAEICSAIYLSSRLGGAQVDIKNEEDDE